MARRKQSLAELNHHLEEHLAFLRASGDAFDHGHDGEAKRLAVSLRVLLHETKGSRSLLGQLGLRRGDFYDISFPDPVGNTLPHVGLAIVASRLGEVPRFAAPLDDMPIPPLRIPFDQWWAAPVLRAKNDETLTRRQLVLAVANQDGGAHVDSALDETYARLSRDNELGFSAVNAAGERLAMKGAELASVRQIAHEVLRTLDPGYRKEPPAKPFVADVTFIRRGTPASRDRKVGRNDPCPCGSGKKAKRCHPQWT